MGRPKRSEFKGAIHLITVTAYAGGHVFYDPRVLSQQNPRAHAADVEYFESLLWDACEQYDGRVHAYFIEPNTLSVVIQTLGAPLGWILHDLLARYSRYLAEHGRIPQGARAFPRRYKSQIVEPEKLPYVVRYVHRREVDPDRRRRSANHPFSSQLIYYGRRPRPDSFIVSATHKALADLGWRGHAAYFEFMATADSPPIADFLSRQIIGDRAFADCVRQNCSKPPRAPSPDEILREVTGTVLHTEPGVVCTSTHLGALARALVAWYAMRTGTAQIGAVARWFDVTSAALRYLIRAHRLKNPQYFSRPLFELFPELTEGKPAVHRDPVWHKTARSRPAGTHALPGP